MSYYSTNAEIAREFKVSKTTVTRWLESAIDGKNNLQINQSDKKVQVYKNEHNFAELLKLKEEGVKYKTSTSYKEVSPKKEFYEIFNYKEQVELVNLLSTKKVIPLKYSYFGEGADMWNQSYENSLNQSTYPVVKNTEELLAISYSTILKKISKFKSINIVDVGPGNGFPLKTLITRLLIDGVTIKNYVAVDISNRMLDIVEKNVRSWFDKKIDFRRYKKDIEHDTLFDLLFENKDQNTLNLVFMLGSIMGNIKNYTRVLENLSYSLDAKDLLIQTDLLNSTKRKTDFSRLSDKKLLLTPQLLNIDIDQCSLSGKYDEQNNSRVGYFLPDKDYLINFDIKGISTQVTLHKNTEIQIWYYKMLTKNNLFTKLEESKLELINTNLSSNLSYIITICQAAANR